ncbi:MAG: polysaccharide deacetylase family protein [Acidobacteria bacterium]|nr:polysaccharide deacetylase family protein [Acidobacteriota bacterium]
MAAALPVLTFHAVDKLASVNSFSPQLFRRGLQRLRQAGYQTIPLLEAIDCIKHQRRFPERSLVITFDDGYESVYRLAFPVLQELKFSATVFLTVGIHPTTQLEARLPSLENRLMLSWREIHEMQKYCIEFGAHTLTHPDLTTLSRQQIEVEIGESKKRLEEATGKAVSSFAYPFGRFDERAREIAQRHFACACSDKLGIANLRSDCFALQRVDAYYLRSEKLFALLPTKFFNGYILSRRVPRTVRRWFRK